MDITHTPLNPFFGAEITSSHQIAHLSEGEFDQLVHLWHTRHVLVLRGQQVTDPEFEAFSARLGPLDPPPNQGAGKKNVPGHPNLYVVSNVLDATGEPIGALGDGEAQWHTDMSYQTCPPIASMLLSRVIPSHGGDTCFVSMTGALQSLPQNLMDFAQQASIKHDGTYDSGGNLRKGMVANDDPMSSAGAVHPAVICHPVTGEQALYLGRRRNAYIPGQTPQASDALLDDIWSCATAEPLVLRHQWRVGDVVLWSNYMTMHMRDAFPADQQRIMHRSQIKGPGVPSQTLPWGSAP